MACGSGFPEGLEEARFAVQELDEVANAVPVGDKGALKDLRDVVLAQRAAVLERLQHVTYQGRLRALAERAISSIDSGHAEIALTVAS
ncbi:hypothetical protein CG740_37960 [Streptomyces sp. CB01201]|nr:hypothetical protein CG740_37960 [Streptomyces sp. CB01201]